MKKVIRAILNYLWTVFSAVTFTIFTGYGIMNWQWWVFVVGLVITVGIHVLIEKGIIFPAPADKEER